MMITGTPVRVLDNVQATLQFLTAQYDVAIDGTIADIKGVAARQRTLVWADRDGTLRPIPAPPQPYMHPVLLPNDQGLIVEIEKTPHDLWHYDFLGGALTRLTFDGGNHHAVLSPDGRWMAFPSDRTAPRNRFLQRTDGSGAAERLYQAPFLQTSTSWSRDGRWLAFGQLHPQTQSDIWVLAMT